LSNWTNGSRDIRLDTSSIAYVIFTSGSTGTPKAVPISHKNFTTCINSLSHSSIMMKNDVVLQTTPVTFDIHIQETLGTLWLGGTLCLLRPKGNVDMNYYTMVIQRHQITLLIMVPALISVLIEHVHDSVHLRHSLVSVRRLCSLGETLLPKVANRISDLMSADALLYNLYGPAECSLISTCHLVTRNDLNSDHIPIGRPLPGYTCQVLDACLQHVLCGHQIGQLFIGGDGVFRGYLHRPNSTDDVLVDLPQTKGIFYRTGDLVRIDPTSGALCYVGRNDFQIKLRGQRIELGEIESVIMRLSCDIINCVVIKYDHDHLEHLVAYIQTTEEMNANTLRSECSTSLPLYMIPSFFIPIAQFPLNINGKVNRNALPLPDFTSLMSSYDSSITDEQPRTEIEREISSIWIDVLRLQSIPSTKMSFFRLGGHSLLLMKLHHKYQTQFHQSLDITDLFRHTTIIDHVRLLHDQPTSMIEPEWHSMHILQGK
jgi:amino acid adenylation domain-containing protein